VLAILKKSENPLKTADTYDALVSQGYKFTFKEAKKVLGIRLYKMLGVQPFGGGLFKARLNPDGADAHPWWLGERPLLTRSGLTRRLLHPYLSRGATKRHCRSGTIESERWRSSQAGLPIRLSRNATIITDIGVAKADP